MVFINKEKCNKLCNEFDELCRNFIEKHDLTANEIYIVLNSQNKVIDFKSFEFMFKLKNGRH